MASDAVSYFTARTLEGVFEPQSCKVDYMFASIGEALDHLMRSTFDVVSDIKIEVLHHMVGIRSVLDDLGSVQYMSTVCDYAFNGYSHMIYVTLDVIPQALSTKVMLAFDLCASPLPFFAMIAREQVLLNFFKSIRQKSNLIFFSFLFRLWSQSLFGRFLFLIGWLTEIIK